MATSGDLNLAIDRRLPGEALEAPRYTLLRFTGTTQFRLRFDLDDDDDLSADYLRFP